MRIIVIHNNYSQFGGEDKVVEQQIKLLNAKGHEAISFHKHNSEITNYSIGKKLRLLKNGYNNKEVCQELEDVILKNKPDIAHVHNIYPLISPAIYKLLKKYNLPIVQTLHNYRFICPNGLMYNKDKICDKCLKNNHVFACVLDKCYRDSYIQSFWYATIISNAYKRGYFDKIDRFIALNTFMKDMMDIKGFPLFKISVIPNFVEEILTNDIEKKDYFVFVGRLSKEKGIISLINAMKILKDINLIIIGQGPMESTIRECITDNDLKNIKLLGFKTGDEKNKLIKAAKGLIVPSVWFENFPTVVLESFSMGTPVIASKIGGLQHMIENNYNGLLFQAEDSEDLAIKIREINDDSSFMKQLSINALNTFMERYSPNVFYDSLIALYNEVLQERQKIKLNLQENGTCRN